MLKHATIRGFFETIYADKDYTRGKLEQWYVLKVISSRK